MGRLLIFLVAALSRGEASGQSLLSASIELQGAPLHVSDREHEAVLEGLTWLLRHQNDDGSWTASFGDQCTPDTPCKLHDLALGSKHDTGLTGLVLLCFLGAGYSDESKEHIDDEALGQRYVIGLQSKKALQWLIEHQARDGGFSTAGEHPNMFNQAIATMAFCEVYALTGNRMWRGHAERGIKFLDDAQKVNIEGTGRWGWRYHSRQEIDVSSRKTDPASFAHELSDADTSVTAWVVMALKSAEMSKIPLNSESYAGALAFVRWVSRDNGLAGYQRPEAAGVEVETYRDHHVYHPGTMSALSMVVRMFLAKDIKDPFLEVAANEIVKDLPVISKDKLSIDYYYWYYASLALNRFDGPDSPRNSGKYWNPWNKMLVPVLLELQDQSEEDDCSRGGWLVPDRWSHVGGALYSTAMSVLTLEVFNR